MSLVVIGHIFMILAIVFIIALSFLFRERLPQAEVIIFIAAPALTAIVGWVGAALIDRLSERGAMLQEVSAWATEVGTYIINNPVRPLSDLAAGTTAATGQVQQNQRARLLEIRRGFQALQLGARNVNYIASRFGSGLQQAVDNLGVQLESHVTQIEQCAADIVKEVAGASLVETMARVENNMDTSTRTLYKTADDLLKEVARTRRRLLSI